MVELSFQEACDYLRQNAAQRCEGDGDARMIEAEAIILDHQPRDPAEAVIMIDALIDNLAAGVRSDRRDIGALAALQAWLTQYGIGAVAA